MKIVYSLEHLRQTLADEADVLSADTSYALTFLRGEVDVHSLSAVRQADRLCDAVIVALLTAEEPSAAEKMLLQQAGAKILFVTQPPSTRSLDGGPFSVGGMGADDSSPMRAGSADLPPLCWLTVPEVKDMRLPTHMLRTLLAVMPLLVTVQPTDTELLTILEALGATFADLFTLQTKPAETALLDGTRRRLRETLMHLQPLLPMERSVSDLQADALRLLSAAGFVVQRLEFWGQNPWHLLAVDDGVKGKVWLSVTVREGQAEAAETVRVWRDGFLV